MRHRACIMSRRSEQRNAMMLRNHARVLAIKCFTTMLTRRNETADATHLAEFHQVEGVVADYDITLGNLIGTSLPSPISYPLALAFHTLALLFRLLSLCRPQQDTLLIPRLDLCAESDFCPSRPASPQQPVHESS